MAGCTKTECIKVWDPRARAMLYELSTGNNGVASMEWDAPRSTLYAATDCIYMDRMGNHHDYRPAKIPGSRQEHPTVSDKVKKEDVQMGEGSDDGEDWKDNEGDDDEEDDDDYDGDYFWPDRATHKETHFGYAFDSGEHRLCKCFNSSSLISH